MEAEGSILEFRLSPDQLAALKKIAGEHGVRLTGELQGTTVVFDHIAVNTSVLEMKFIPR